MVNCICTKEKSKHKKEKSMIDKFCAYLTKKIRKEMPEVDDERAEVIMYGLQNIIGELPKGIIILIIAYILGIFKLTVISILIIAPYRCVSGGVHMKTHIGCIIYTLLLYSGSSLLGKYIVLTGNVKIMLAIAKAITPKVAQYSLTIWNPINLNIPSNTSNNTNPITTANTSSKILAINLFNKPLFLLKILAKKFKVNYYLLHFLFLAGQSTP